MLVSVAFNKRQLVFNDVFLRHSVVKITWTRCISYKRKIFSDYFSIVDNFVNNFLTFKLFQIGNVIKFLLEYLGIQYNEKVYNVTKVEEWFDEKWKLGLDFPNVRIKRLLTLSLHPNKISYSFRTM
jgi:hypothetical protein